MTNRNSSGAKPVPLWRWLVALVLILGSWLLLPAAQTGSRPNDRIVVLISIDGLPAFALDDPRLPVPTLRRLMAEGAHARRMLPINPSITWPSHTSMVTGVQAQRHGVLMNGALVRKGPGQRLGVNRYCDRAEILKAPTIYDLANQRGLSTGQVNWVAIQNAPTVNWEFAYRPDPNGVIAREMISAGLIREKDLDDFRSASESWQDQIWTQAAVHILTKHRPNVLLFHLLALDDLQHRYGPGTPAASAGIALVDTRVQQFLDALRREHLEDRTTVLVVSDHGFRSAPHSVRPNVRLRQARLIRQGRSGAEYDAYVVAQGGNAMVYVTSPENRRMLVPRLAKLLTEMEGVARVVEPSDYAGLGLPLPSQNAGMGDLMLFAKEGYWFSDKEDGPEVVDTIPGTTVGTHGYPSDDRAMDAVFIAWGRGIRKGTSVDTVRITDLAPTLAHLLGIAMTEVEGRVLREIME